MGKRIVQRRKGTGTNSYRALSFKFTERIEFPKYDPKNSDHAMKGEVVEILDTRAHHAPLARIAFENGEKAVIPAPFRIKIGDNVESGGKASLNIGNNLALKNIPDGTFLSSIETYPGSGPKLCRSSGSFARLLSKTPDGIIIELPSKKQKTLNIECRAVIGIVSGSGRTEKPFVKAGVRHFARKVRGNVYPRVSGVAMNALNHPFGSGRGRHAGKPKTPPRNAPAGRNVGAIRARRTGRRK
ncbi:50S ribosomal protein L2 [Candidatus Woesearchaeota archaeon]|nr:50S ribosomal protein L2 [Candidatus Woesearchaeota archaeon]